MASPQETLAHALVRFNAGDLEGYLALYDERATLYGYGPEPIDLAGARAFYEGVAAAFEDMRLTAEETLWDGDACAVRYTLTGRHVGPFMGVPATGREVAFRGMTMLHFADGKVIDRHQQVDLLGVLVQLGAVPAPA